MEPCLTRKAQIAANVEFDALHGGRELLPIEQLAYEAEGAERFAKYHGHGRSFPKNAEFCAAAEIGKATASAGEGWRA